VQQTPPLETEKVKLKVVAYNYSMGHFDHWLDLGCTSVATSQDQDRHSEWDKRKKMMLEASFEGADFDWCGY
jgi:hypothetical protein